MRTRTRTLAAAAAAAAFITPLAVTSAGAQDRGEDGKKQDGGGYITPRPLLTGTEADGDVTFGAGSLPEAARGKAKTVDVEPGEKITPRLDTSDEGAETKKLTSTWCSYRYKTKVKGKPPIDNLYRYGVSKVRKKDDRRASHMVHDSQGGQDAPRQTTSTSVDWYLPIEIPDDWPQPSQISGWANPTFKGAMFVNSNYWWWGGTSLAGAQQKISIGMARDNDTRWRTLHKMDLERNNGTEATEKYKLDIGDGNEVNYANMDTTPAHTYTFRVRSKSTAWSDPATFAGAQAQTDFGGDIDAPGHLLDNGYVQPNGPFGDALIEYKAPKKVKCQ
ncbi:hypothetical protein [Streptomyces sp. 3N207]|uniref:hypothetical protein n=1 Tax=Streptomyces sp. 3N207 TaxID=3457417 RepID=UPI003FD5DDF4